MLDRRVFRQGTDEVLAVTCCTEFEEVVPGLFLPRVVERVIPMPSGDVETRCDVEEVECMPGALDGYRERLRPRGSVALDLVSLELSEPPTAAIGTFMLDDQVIWMKSVLDLDRSPSRTPWTPWILGAAGVLAVAAVFSSRRDTRRSTSAER